MASSDDESAVTHDGIGHRFRFNYRRIKSMENGECISTPSFRLGKHKWALLCYPQGFSEDDVGCVSLFLKFLSGSTEVSVSFELAILEKNREGMRSTGSVHATLMKGSTYGCTRFIRRNLLEDRYLMNGWFVLICTFTSAEISEEIPHECLLLKDVSKLIDTNDMADVKFSVGGETFEAHRTILGARSAVFKAELFGSMAEKETEVIPIEDIQASVFKALLKFVYTDSLPDVTSCDMILDLIVAADRYAILGLIAKCQEWLLENLSLDTVVGFLIVADRHGFREIKDECLEFMSEQENLLELALTEEYGQMVCNYPSLLRELRERFNQS